MIADLAAAFQHSLDAYLTSVAASLSFQHSSFTVLMHVPRLATDKGFVDFNFAPKLAAESFVLHSKPDSVQHEPCGLLGNAECPVDLPGGNTVLAIGEEPNAWEPFVQAKWGILEDGPDFNGKLAFGMPVAALPAHLVFEEPDLCRSACRTNNAIRPALRHHVVQAILGISEVNDCIPKTFWLSGFHVLSVRRKRVLVKYIFTAVVDIISVIGSLSCSRGKSPRTY